MKKTANNRYQLRFEINVTDLHSESEREAAPPPMYWVNTPEELEKLMLQEFRDCIRDLNDPQWIKECDGE